MNDVQKEFYEIVAQVRAQLEYQRALGVKSIAKPSGLETARVRPSIREAATPVPAQKGQAASRAIPQHDETTASPAQVQQETLDSIRMDLGECDRCKLSKGRKNIVFGEGNPAAELVFVGEGPGFDEDEQGRPFVGEAGQLLTDIIVKGMKLKREDVYICNVVKCRPPNNRNPEPDEISACEPFLRRQLLSIKPRVIVTLGNVPTQTLLKSKDGITRVRGSWRDLDGISLMPTFHPAYLLRNPKDKSLVWADIQQVMKKLGINK